MKKLWKNTYFKYTILFFLCVGFMYFPFFIIRRGLIANWDSFNQEYPLFIYIGKYIRDLLTGTVRQFDFRIGLGDDVIAALNWHGFGDVFQIISALFPLEYSETGYAIVMVLKFYLCGISFMIFAGSYLKKECCLLSGALLYTFSIFSLAKGLEFWVFLNPIITFPVILYGIDRIREDRRKISFLFIGALFLQALSGFYFLYMEAVLAVVYFVVVSFCDNASDWKGRFLKLLKDGTAIALQALLGVGLGAVILLPAIYGYFSSSRTSRESIFQTVKDIFLYGTDYYLKHLKCLIVPEVWESIATISVVVLLGLIAAFATKKVGTQFKVMCVMLVIGFCLPVVGSMMNGFSYCTDRWYFGVQLFLILTALLGMEKEQHLCRTQICVFIFTAAGLVLGNLSASGISKGTLFRSFVFLCIIVILPVAWNHKRRERYLLASVFLSVIFCGCLTFGTERLGGSGYAWGFMPVNAALEDMRSSVSETEQKDRFERTDIYQSSLATSLVMDYYGTTEYFSTLNESVSEFYRALNISPGVRSATWILKGLDSREELLSLLSVGQYTDFSMENDQAVPTVKQNEDYLPLGFTYTDWISRESFDRLNTVQQQSMILKAVVLDEADERGGEALIDMPEENREVSYTAEYIDVECEGNRFTTKPGSRIRVTLESDDDLDSVYVQFIDFVVEDEGVHEFYVGNKNLQLRSRDYVYYMGSDEFWVYVTELFEENGKKYFDLLFSGENTFTLQDMKIYQHEADTASVQERGKHVLTDLSVGVNTVTGNIRLDQREWLFLSIPYSTGWRAYVDGEETGVWKANVGFIALDIPEGSHLVQLVYETPGIRIGAVVSGISLLLLIALVIYRKRKQL